MLKSSIFNQSHFFKIKIKDCGVLNFSCFKINHFVYTCTGREGMYQNARLRINREGRPKFRLFAYVIVPNQKRVIKKLAKLLKPSYLNKLFDTNILPKLKAVTGGAR